MLNWAVRYVGARQMLDSLNDRVGSIVDVGSGEHGISAVCKMPFIIQMDRSVMGGTQESMEKRIRSDALQLPLKSKSVDVCLSLDLLEHLQVEQRSVALAEMARVARRALIVGCPIGPVAPRLDRRLAHELDRRGCSRPSWLDEHLAIRVPTEEGLRLQLPCGWTVRERSYNDPERLHSLVASLEHRKIAGRVLTRWTPSRLPGWLTTADSTNAYRIILLLEESGS